MKSKSGFTMVELLVVVAIIGTLSSFILPSVGRLKNGGYTARALQEFHTFEQAMFLYLLDNGEYPPDVSRNIPPGLETYLSSGDWPGGPYPGSVYDWDNVTGSDPYVQISLRFCDISGNNCHFPDEPWAEDFDHQSAMYWCFQGNCRSHPNKPISHPGYCVNCN